MIEQNAKFTAFVHHPSIEIFLVKQFSHMCKISLGKGLNLTMRVRIFKCELTRSLTN